jgi:hypothetical protein
MPRYFFNVVTPTRIVSDVEGTELGSLEDARQEAISDARDLMAAAMREGYDISGRRINIADGAGQTLIVVKFSEALTMED